MSTLTKICVVLLVLLGLFASVVFIQEAASKTNWRTYAQGQRTRRNLAESEAAYQQLAADNWKRLYSEEVKSGKIASDRYQENITTSATRVSSLTGELARAEAGRSEAVALNRALQGTIDTQLNQGQKLIAQLDGERSKNIQLADQLRGAQDKINEDVINLESARKNAEFLQEQLTNREIEVTDLTNRVDQLTKELEVVRAGAGLGAGTSGTVIATAPRIDGEVLAVEGELASLNVGRASGVKKGMEFKIYRNAAFIAHLKVAEVYASTCAGLIENRVGEVKKGDKASTRLDTE
ncbi:MAG TPA: hypothetical protein VFJ30_01635 [Phycisphaerae bacterium]|nr:hypothetical protein [Phycisphaerae bacterium]